MPFWCLAVQHGGSGCVEASRAALDHWPPSHLEITILTRVIRHAQTKWPPVKHSTKSISVSWNISQGNQTGIRVKASEYLLVRWLFCSRDRNRCRSHQVQKHAGHYRYLRTSPVLRVFLETKASGFFEQHNCAFYSGSLKPSLQDSVWLLLFWMVLSYVLVKQNIETGIQAIPYAKKIYFLKY